MTQEPAETAATPQAEGDQETVRAAFSRLYTDGRAYAQAEGQRQKLRAGLVGAGVRDAAIMGVVALMLLFAAIVTLLIGLVIALAPVLGPLWATLAVFGGALLVAALLLLLAKARIGRMMKAIRP